MSDEIPVEAAPKKRRGRPRKDVSEAPAYSRPIDGDWDKDVVLGKDPSKAYAWVHADDLGKMRTRGLVQSHRDSGLNAPNDYNTEGEIRSGDLALMEEPIENQQRRQAAGERRFQQNFGAEEQKIRDHVAAVPGSQYKTERT
jgi:hypothetical protein